MAVVRDDLKLTQGANRKHVIASVAIHHPGRLLAGWMCDALRPASHLYGFNWLWGIPGYGDRLGHGYHSVLLFRLAIGIIGASFVITQHHTSIMFRHAWSALPIALASRLGQILAEALRNG